MNADAKPLDHWPRLSETLAGPKAPDRCQACGRFGSHDFDRKAASEADGGTPDYLVPTLTRWREHDQFDRPEPIVVVLCRECSDRLIEKHPRLYAAIGHNEPFPGTMTICLDCRLREGTACASPLQQRKGGPGLAVIVARPSKVHLCRRGKGARSGWEDVYPEPPRGCEGKETA